MMEIISCRLLSKVFDLILLILVGTTGKTRGSVVVLLVVPSPATDGLNRLGQRLDAVDFLGSPGEVNDNSFSRRPLFLKNKYEKEKGKNLYREKITEKLAGLVVKYNPSC